MASVVKISDLSSEESKRLLGSCVIKTTPNIYSGGEMEEINCIDSEGNKLFVPIGTRPPSSHSSRGDGDSCILDFTYDLLTPETDPSKRNRDQTTVAEEAISQLDSKRSTFLSLHTGFGKCLGFGTTVRMWDGSVKRVEDVVNGDLLRGLDLTPRKVTGIVTGCEDLCTIAFKQGLPGFTCTLDHILVVIVKPKITLYEDRYYVKTFHKQRKEFGDTIFYTEDESRDFAKRYSKSADCITELPASFFIEMKDDDLEMFYCISQGSFGDFHGNEDKVDDEFEKQRTLIRYPPYYRSPYDDGYAHSMLGHQFPIDDDYLTTTFKTPALEYIAGWFDALADGKSKFILQEEQNFLRVISTEFKMSIYNYDVLDQFSTLLRRIGITCYRISNYIEVFGMLKEVPFRTFNPPESIVTATPNSKSQFSVIPVEQDFFFGFELDGDNRFLLESGIVTHNTSLGCFLACHYKQKVGVVCYSKSLRGQWKQEIEKFTGGKAKVSIVKGTEKELDKSADVYIFGITTPLKFTRKQLSIIKTLITDEAHMSTRTLCSQTLLRFTPERLIGLSATPDRPDGLHALLIPYFGKPDEYIHRHEVKNFVVKKTKTPFKPEIEYMMVKGTSVLSWTTVINSLAINPDRHKFIGDIAICEPGHKIMVLCDRIASAKGVFDYLKENDQDVVMFSGSKTTYDKTKRITITTLKKGGTGLDDSSLTMLILAADAKDVRQYEGRIRTTNNVIYDIVDNFGTLERHWDLRKEWYLSRGASIENDSPGMQKFQNRRQNNSKPRWTEFFM